MTLPTSSNYRATVRALSSLALIINLSCVAWSQTVAPERGFHAGNSYAISDIETISPQSGNLMLNMPLGSLPAGRGGMSAGLSLHYNSKLWNMVNSDVDGINAQSLDPSDDGGWKYGYLYKFRADLNPAYNNDAWDVKLTMPDGSAHVLVLPGYTNYDGTVQRQPGSTLYGTQTFSTIDGTYLRLDHSEGDNWTLYLPDGKRVVHNPAAGVFQRIYDRNGNYIDFIENATDSNYSGHRTTYIKDQLDRKIVIEYEAATNEDWIRSAGFGEELVMKVLWRTIIVRRTYTSCISGCYNPYIPPVTTSTPFRVVDKIYLTSQVGSLYYTFDYNATATANPSLGWGEVSQVTLPSGAYSTYAYLHNNSPSSKLPMALINNRPTEKVLNYKREYDGSDQWTSETWTYSASVTGGGVTTSATITAPDGGVTTEYYEPPGTLPGSTCRTIKSQNADGSIIERYYQNNVPGEASILYASNSYVKYEFVSIEDSSHTLVKTAIKEYNYDKNGNVTQVKEYDFFPYSAVPRDSNGKPTGLPSNSSSYLKRISVTEYYSDTPDASSTNYTDADGYQQTTSPRLRSLPKTSEIRDAANNAVSRTELFYDYTTYETNTKGGNLTEKKSWDSTKGTLSTPLTGGNSISTSSEYDAYGNPTLTTDARGVTTSICYATGDCTVSGQTTSLYPTRIKVAANYSALALTTNKQYDFNTGLTTTVTDADNNVTTATTYDALGRPTLVENADGKPEETQTVMIYSDSDRRVIVRSDLNQLEDGKLVSIKHYDQLGRLRLTRQLEDAVTENPEVESHGVKVQTRYVTSGGHSYQLSSSPYEAPLSSDAGSEPSMGWAQSKSDSRGRLIEVQSFGGATMPAPLGTNGTGIGTVLTSYDAQFTTVTDPAGKLRRSMTNGLGQLVRVDEPNEAGVLGETATPNQATSYAYDALSNLIQVSQGSQTRTFVYSSLGRLISATNPESGTISYTYDNNGNLLTKTDARGVVSTYSYDALNRNTSVTYTNDPASTPTVTRTYDGGSNGKGKIWTTTSGSFRTTIDGYDGLGRPLMKRQQVYAGAWQSYTVQRTYDRAGHVLTQTYPSGHTVDYSYDQAGRISSFSGNLGEGATRTYANEFKYTESGALQQEKFGTDTPLYHKQRYNRRGQLWDMRLSTVPFATDPANGDRGSIVNYYSTINNYEQGASGADNNGNLLRQETYIPGSSFFQDNFTYDPLNRLKSISEKLNGTGTDTFKQSFTFDRWGNRRIDEGNTTGIPYTAYTVNTTNNRLGAPEGADPLTYDEAGNLLTDPTNESFASGSIYDAENRLVQVEPPLLCSSFDPENPPICTPSGIQATRYGYDGDGRRVLRTLGGMETSYETWQIYGFDGELLAEYPQDGTPVIAQPQKEYGYRDGQLLVTAEPWTNLALNKPATQTSNYSASTTANKAVNGDGNGILGSNSASATDSHANSWWQVDLQSVQTIASITIWGRTDCCPEMSSNFYVFVSDSPFTSYDLSATIAQAGVSNYQHSSYAGPASIQVNRTGRYVRVQLAGTNSLVLGEVQVWSQAAKINWLVTDHLGTPRMVVDKTGSLSGLSRHDYLPFGEEILVGTGGRTTGQGYAASDGMRQQFTSKERDNETGLDYFLARYYSSTQGRFTSPDEFKDGPDELFVLGSGDSQKQALPFADISQPQSLNKYQYCYNSPLRYIDPDGHDVWEDIKQGVIAGVKVVANIAMEGSPLIAAPNGISTLLTGEPIIRQFEGSNDMQRRGMLAGGVAAIFAPGPGGKSNALRRGLTSTEHGVIRKVKNILATQLDTKSLQGAVREAAGEVVARKVSGQPYDHIEKVKNGLKGLVRHGRSINQSLTDTSLNSEARAALQRTSAEVKLAIQRTRRLIRDHNIQ